MQKNLKYFYTPSSKMLPPATLMDVKFHPPAPSPHRLAVRVRSAFGSPTQVVQTQSTWSCILQIIMTIAVICRLQPCQWQRKNICFTQQKNSYL
jgi:hypothetical protein